MSARFNGRLGIKQRVLTDYRASFFDLLAERCEDGLGVFAGQPRPREGISTAADLVNARLFRSRNLYLSSGPAALFWQGGLFQWLRSWQPDALILEANPRCLDVPFAVNWMRRRGRPVIGWGLGTLSLTEGSEFLRSVYRRRFLGLFDAMIAYSSKAFAEYRTIGVPRDKVFIAHNAAVPKPDTPPQRPDRFSANPRVLFVGRLVEAKRLDILIEACRQLSESLSPQLWVVGDGPLREYYEDLARAAHPATHFYGELHGEKLAKVWTQADLFILPGRGGIAIQESMSFGLPVIASEADGTERDLVRPGNGWLVNPEDVISLKNAMEEALSNPAKLREMGKESFRIVAEEINTDRMADIFVSVLDKLA